MKNSFVRLRRDARHSLPIPSPRKCSAFPRLADGKARRTSPRSRTKHFFTSLLVRWMLLPVKAQARGRTWSNDGWTEHFAVGARFAVGDGRSFDFGFDAHAMFDG